MAHALDFDNTWYPLNHPTSPTLPAILAIAEHERLPGRKVVEAIVAAFEVQGRVRLAATGLETGSGFHKPGMTGTFGAVAGAARAARSRPRTQTLMAFGLAGSRAGSIAINTGTMTKSSHSGHARAHGRRMRGARAHGLDRERRSLRPERLLRHVLRRARRAAAARRRVREAAAHDRSGRRLQEASEQLLHAPADRRGARAARRARDRSARRSRRRSRRSRASNT